MENRETNQEKKKIRAQLSFGLPGHENEYVFIPDSDEYIPAEIGEAIQEELRHCHKIN